MSMILYNIRQRGPFEYDKFILNSMQLSNEIHLLLKKLDILSQDNLTASVNELDNFIDDLNSVGHDLLFLKMAMED